MKFLITRIKKLSRVAVSSMSVFTLLCMSVSSFLLGVTPVYAYDAQTCQQYNQGVVCITLDEIGNDYDFRVWVDSFYGSGVPSLSCTMRHSSSGLLFNKCDDRIRYTGNSGEFLIHATFEGQTGLFAYSVANNDFTTQFSQVSPGSNNNNSVYGADEIRITTNQSSYQRNEWADVTVNIYDNNSINNNFDGTVRFVVEKRNSNGSYYSTSSSDYDLDRTSYTFNNDGSQSFNNLVRFTNDGQYRLRAYISGGPQDYEYFSIGNGSSNNGADEVRVTTSSSQHYLNNWIDTTVQIYDNGSINNGFDGTVTFLVEKKSSNGYYHTAHSSDFDLNRTSYTFNNDGKETFDNLVRFTDNGNYRLRVAIAGGPSEYEYFSIGNTSTGNDTDKFIVKASDRQPNVGQRVYFEVEAVDNNGSRDTNYEETVDILVYERSSSNASWSYINTTDTTNSTFNISDFSYQFTNSDSGIENDNQIWIEFLQNNKDYRVVFRQKNTSSIDGEDYVYLLSTPSSTVDEFIVTADDTSPQEDQRVYFDVEARNDNGQRIDYVGDVNVRIYRRDGSNSSWVHFTSSSNTNPVYTISDHSPTFTSSNNGYANELFWIEIEPGGDRYDWRIEVEDPSNASADGYTVLYMDGASSDAIDEIRLSVDDNDPSENQTVDMSFRVYDNGSLARDFDGKLKIEIDRRSKNSNSWSYISSSLSNSYYTLQDDEVNFRSYDDGVALDRVYVKFKNDYYDYRIRVMTQDERVEDSVIIYMATNGNNNDDVYDINLSTDDKTPEKNEWVDLRVELLDRDRDRETRETADINLKVYYKEGGGFVQTTSSSYYSIEDNEIRVTSSDDGYVNENNFIKFHKERIYKVVATVDGNTSATDSITFTVGDADEFSTTSADPDQFLVKLISKNIDVGDRVDMSVFARTYDHRVSTSYRGEGDIKFAMLSSASDRSWGNIGAGDVSQYINELDYTSADGGSITKYDVFKFNDEGLYRIEVEDRDENLEGYAYVFIPDVSFDGSVSGFSSSELRKLQLFYNLWDDVMNALVSKYPRLNGNRDWENIALDFYEQLEDTVTDSSGKWSRYSRFQDAIEDFVRDTVREAN